MSDTLYYEVVKAFIAYKRVAKSPSSTFIGHSRLYGNVYQPIKIKPGDQLHFVSRQHWYIVRKGKTILVRLALSEWHPLENHYVHKKVGPPEECVRLFGKNANGIVYQAEEVPILKTQPGTVFGRSLDTVVPTNFTITQ